MAKGAGNPFMESHVPQAQCEEIRDKIYAHLAESAVISGITTGSGDLQRTIQVRNLEHMVDLLGLVNSAISFKASNQPRVRRSMPFFNVSVG